MLHPEHGEAVALQLRAVVPHLWRCLRPWVAPGQPELGGMGVTAHGRGGSGGAAGGISAHAKRCAVLCGAGVSPVAFSGALPLH